MNLRRILALATRIVHQFRRDRRTLFLLFVVPVLVLSLLAWIYRGDGASPVTLAIVNEGRAPSRPRSSLGCRRTPRSPCGRWTRPRPCGRSTRARSTQC